MTVQSICRPPEELVSADADASVGELCKLMATRRVGCVVIEADGEPLGIVTDRDVAMAYGEGKALDGLTAGDVMQRSPHTADTTDGVAEVCAKMAEYGIRRMPVVDDGKLCGIVTLDDMVVLLETELHDISEVIRAESPPYQMA